MWINNIGAFVLLVASYAAAVELLLAWGESPRFNMKSFVLSSATAFLAVIVLLLFATPVR